MSKRQIKGSFENKSRHGRTHGSIHHIDFLSIEGYIIKIQYKLHNYRINLLSNEYQRTISCFIVIVQDSIIWKTKFLLLSGSKNISVLIFCEWEQKKHHKGIKPIKFKKVNFRRFIFVNKFFYFYVGSVYYPKTPIARRNLKICYFVGKFSTSYIPVSKALLNKHAGVEGLMVNSAPIHAYLSKWNFYYMVVFFFL